MAALAATITGCDNLNVKKIKYQLTDDATDII